MGDDGGLHSPLIRPLWWGRGRLVLPIFEESMSTLSRGRSEHPAEKKRHHPLEKTTKTHNYPRCSMYGIFTNIWMEAGGLHFSNQNHHHILFLSVKQAIPRLESWNHCYFPQVARDYLKYRTYCWWKKSCTSWYDKYPIIYKVVYIPGGAGFQPSTSPKHLWRKCEFGTPSSISPQEMWMGGSNTYPHTVLKKNKTQTRVL